MKKARNLWHDLPQGGSRYGSVLTRLFLLLCLLATTQAGWAQTELVNIDFKTWTTNSSISGNGTSETINGVTFLSKSDKPFSVTQGTGLTFCNNNLDSGNYFFAIPLSGISGSITITIKPKTYSGNKASVKYVLKTNTTTVGTPGSTGTQIQASSNGGDIVKTVNCAYTNAVLYIGRQSGDEYNQTLESIVVTTPIAYDVTLDNDNSTATRVVSANASAAMPTKLKNGNSLSKPSMNNYTFGGYYDDHAGEGTQYYTNNCTSAHIWDKNSTATLYAKWTQTVTLDANTSNHGSGSNTSATAIYKGSALTGFTATTPASNYSLNGFYTSATGGTKVLNADGSFASTNVTDYITSGKWSRTGAGPTLYAQYVEGSSSSPVDLTNSQFAWSATSYTATIGGSNTFPTLTNSENVSVTYSATTAADGNTASDVASIDGSGNITLNQAGTAYIKAIFAGSSSYNAKTVTYTLTVNAAASTSGTATFDYSASGANATSWTQSPITVATTSTGIDGSKHYLKTGNSNADDLELTISGANITKVVVHYQSTSYLPTTITANDGTNVTTTGTTSTWDNATGTNELILTLQGNKRRVTGIDVTYGESVATYDIHYNTVDHGELSGAAKAAAGARVTVTAEPDENYGLSTLTIYKYDDDSNITSSCNVSGNQFTMPAFAVKVGGTFAELPTITKIFDSTKGNVTTSPDTHAAPGTMVTINANAKSGYSVGTITVTDAGSNNITVTDNQFTMPNSNVTVTVTFNAAAVSAGDKWNFTKMTEADEAAYKADNTKWNTTDNSSYYYSKFSTSAKNEQTAVISTTIQQIKDLKFVRTDGGALSAGKVRIYLPTSTDAGYLNFDTSNGGIVLPSMAAGTLITVDFNGGGSSYGILPTNATTVDGADITSVIKSATRTTTTFKVKTAGEVIITGNNSKVKFYKITVGEAVDVAEPTFSKADGSGYDGTGDLSVTVTTNEKGEGTKTTYWKYATTALDRDALVATGATEGTATITKEDVNEQTIVLSAVTKYVTGDNNTYYSEVVTASYPYTGTKTLGFNVANMNVPVGGQQTFAPTFTYKDGTEFDPEEDTDNPDLQSIYDYFNFTFTETGNTNVPTENLRLDEGGVVIAKAAGTGGANATVGSELTVTIKADRKTGISSWPFDQDSYTVTGVKATVVKRGESGAHMDFWWDPTFTKHVEQGTDWDYGTTDADAKVSVFSTPYPNGRMIYLEVEDGWTAYVAAGLADKSAKIIQTGKQNEWDKTNKVNYLKYRRNDPTDVYPDVDVPFNGLPLVVNDEDWGSDTQKTFYVNIKTVDANGKEGSPVKARYTILKNDDYRPAAPSLTPAESNAQRNTAQTVLTQGAEGAYIYGKFGGGYTVPNLVNSEGINGGRTSVGVFSTEVKDRKITAVQVGTGLGTTTDNYFYVSKEKNNTYNYLFASEISLKSNTYTTNVGTADPVNVKALIDKITYYNKDSKKYINIADSIQARSGEQAENLTTTEKDRVTYSIEKFNGADDTTIDKNSGLVTIGQKSGYVVVTATYHGGYSKTVSDRKSTTDESKATYTIYLVNPDEQIPTITPGSRNFVDEQSFMIQAPDRWNALYMVVEKDKEEDEANYNAAIATYSSDDPKVKMLEAGEYIRLTVTKTSKVRAFAYDPSATEHNVPGQPTTTSKEVTATYTKLDKLKAPTLSPYGTSEEPHIRTAKSLTVIATTNDPYAGLEVYYTLDGSDPTPTTGEKYNGSEKINISGASTTIKAITYRPETGQISPVTTGVYMYTGSIKQPKFKVKGNYYTSGTITVSPTDEITIESEDGGDIYYTLDGSTPTTADAVPYTTGFTIVKNTTGKAIAVKDDASSPITTVEFELATEKNDLWEAVEETTPGGKLDANDRYVAVGNTGHSSTKAVKYLTATFGGMDAAGWNKASIGEKTQGTPLDGVGKYSISTTRDVWDETDAEVKNTANTVHGKTFALPAKGNFVRFEPERDGDLTIWLLQQGGLHYTDDGGFCNQFIRLRPVYMFDEKGTSIPADAIKSSARLSDNWDNLDVSDTPNEQGRYGNWVAKNKSQNGVVNKYYDEGESETIYNMYKSYLTTHDKGAGDPIEPFAITNETVKEYTGINGTGYVMPSGGNVKYTFPVKGGKSYYFFGYRTKLAIRGFQFTPSSETVEKSVTVADNTADIVATIKAGETGGEIAADEICNVTYNRKFTAGKWAAVTFPFSVSVAQMKEVFGNQVDLIHFDNVSGSKINFKRHWYPMIVAGTPVFIKPSKEDMGESVEFKGVRIEAETVNAVSGEGGYKMTGSFTPATIKEGDYYISGGKLAVRKGSSINTNACRSWLTADSNTGARFDLTTGTADAFAEEAWSVIGNPQPFVASDETVVTYINGVQEDGIINNIFEGPTGIYTINGQLIRKDATSLEGLSKGIYIVNGKKIAVK